MSESKETTYEPIIINGKRVGTRIKNPKMTFTAEELKGFKPLSDADAKQWIETLRSVFSVSPITLSLK